MRTLTGLLLALAGVAQTPQFEVASVKYCGSSQSGQPRITTDPSRLRADNVDIKQLIGYAYDVSPLVIAGHIPAACFEVEAETEGSHSRSEVRLMLQALLADRFGLRLHHETREL